MCIGLIISQHDFHEIILNSSVVVGRSTWQNDARIKAIVMLQSADVCIRVRSIFEFQVRHINKKIILTTASYFFLNLLPKSRRESELMKKMLIQLNLPKKLDQLLKFFISKKLLLLIILAKLCDI